MGQQMQGIFAIIPGLSDKLVQHFRFLFLVRLPILGGKIPGQCLFHIQW
jgi:hypothetical protein